MKKPTFSSKNKNLLIPDKLRMRHANLPEFNPDEYLKCDLKVNVHMGNALKNEQASKDRVVCHVKAL